MNWVLVGLLVLLGAIGVTGVMVFKSEAAKTAQANELLDAERAAHTADVQHLKDAVTNAQSEAAEQARRADALDKTLGESRQQAQQLQATINDQKLLLDNRIKTDPVVATWATTAIPQYVIDWLQESLDPATPAGSDADQDAVRIPTFSITAADAGPGGQAVEQLQPGGQQQGLPGSAPQLQCGQKVYPELWAELPGPNAKVTLADGGTSTGVAGEASACWGGLAGSPDRPSTFILAPTLPEIHHNG